MACWWRKIAEAQGITPSATAHGSWKRIVALAFVGTPAAGSVGSWPRVLAQTATQPQTQGPWTKRLTPTGQTGGSHARQLSDSGRSF